MAIAKPEMSTSACGVSLTYGNDRDRITSEIAVSPVAPFASRAPAGLPRIWRGSSSGDVSSVHEVWKCHGPSDISVVTDLVRSEWTWRGAGQDVQVLRCNTRRWAVGMDGTEQSLPGHRTSR